MNWLGLLLSVAIGVSLGFFGGGGSILTVPLFVYVFGFPPKQAIASSLLVVATASALAALQHARAGNVRPRVALLFGSAGMAGAYLGARVAAFIAGELLLVLFAAMMGLTAFAMWRGRTAPSAPAREGSTTKLLLQGLSVGGFTGLVGAGGGFLIVPALVLWAGLPMPAAVGTSLLVIVLNSLAGFAGYVGHVRVDLGPLVLVALCAIAGSVLGSRLAQRVDPRALRRAFAGFVLLMAAVILVREANVVLKTAAASLPQTLPQLLLAVAMLALGVVTGRASRGSRPGPDSRFEYEGTGI